jgi:four helix bundle protein
LSKNNVPEKVNIKNVKDLIVYQRSMVLSDKVYEIIRGFPDFEKFELVSQIRRSSNSISANLAEGNGQTYLAKQYSFLNNALGSASEVRCHLEHAYRRAYISKEKYDELEQDTIIITKLLLGMMKKIKNEIKNEINISNNMNN